ncbi:unnamed protein product [Auanema sp. JU1783]|nr:unnamed protein product [Auanema sp. JU1783]
MAQFKKKFTFDDPEDSYWNESGSNSSSLFDDLPSKQWAARAAVDSLFDVAKEAEKTKPKEAPTTLSNAPFEKGDSEKTRDRIVDEIIHTRTAALKLDDASPRGGAPSVVSECSVSSLPSDAHRLDLDYSRLKEEHRKLQRFLDDVRHKRFTAVGVHEAVRRLLKGEPVSLEFYRSKNDKVQLLDAAIDMVDGNVIQTVVLFLQQTLSDSIFRDILLRKPEAAEEYILYLKKVRDYDELVNTLFALGRNADAAMVEFSAAIKNKVINQKIQALKKCTRSAFSDPFLSSEANLVNDYISLLERQVPIETADASSKVDNFKVFPVTSPLVGSSALSTLYYSCLYHYDLPAHSLASPLNVKECLRLSEKEFVWTAISALVCQSRWPDVERVLQPKNLIGALQNRGIMNSKLSCPFSWQNLLYILHNNRVMPPKDFCCRILRAVQDQDLRLKLAEKYSITDIVMECLVAQKDRQKLIKYASTLTPHTPEAYKAAAALNNSGTRWKN